MRGDLLVGWFWHTYPCYSGGQWWTCAWQSAAYWTGDPPAFTEAPHGSEPEYDVANGTDGQQVVGTLTFEYTEFNYTSYAYLWSPPNNGVSLHPGAAAFNSFANTVDGGRHGVETGPQLALQRKVAQAGGSYRVFDGASGGSSGPNP